MSKMINRGIVTAMVLLLGATGVSLADDLKQEYLNKIDELIPGMGQAEIPARKNSQMTLEQMCFEASAPGKSAERKAISEAIMLRTSPDVAKPARVWMLRKIESLGREEVVPTLTTLLRDEDPQVRELARRALQNNPTEPAAAALRDALTSAKDDETKVAMINALGFRRDADSVSALIPLTSGQTTSVARAAIAALGDIADHEAVKALMLMYSSNHDSNQDIVVDALLRAAQSLHRQNPDRPAGVRICNQLLKSSDLPTRIAATSTLGQIGNASTVKPLAERAANTEGGERTAARGALMHLEGDDVDSTIVALIGESSGATKAELINAASTRNIHRASSVVLAAANDSDPAVRGAVISAMSRIGGAAELPKLIDLLSQGVAAEYREDAETAIIGMCQRIENEDKRAVPVAQAMQDADTPTQLSLIRILAALQGSTALDAVREASQSSDPNVKRAASAALSTWEPTYIKEWVFSGVYDPGVGPTDQFDKAYAPENDPDNAKWQPVKDAAFPSIPAAIALHKVVKGDNHCGYVRTTIHSNREQSALFLFGSDDGVKAWLNGEVIQESNVIRGVSCDQDQSKATLKKGENVLMLKVTQGGGDWAVCCGIQAPNGGPISGLRFEAK